MTFVGLTPEGSSALGQSESYLRQFGIEWPSGYGAIGPLRQMHVPGMGVKLVFDQQGKLYWHNLMGGSLDDALASLVATDGA